MSTMFVGARCSFSFSLAGVAGGVAVGYSEEEVGARPGSVEGWEGLGAKRRAGRQYTLLGALSFNSVLTPTAIRA